MKEIEKKINMTAFLYLIEITNFKSFRGKLIIGPFDRFSCIIGPNGHGKSNIMDAISFVMGEKINKLRITKLSDLIYGANVGSPISNSASVKATFKINNDTTELNFIRIIDCSRNKYQINDEFVSYELYISRLNELGLNIKANNFLVFQGAIESIVTNNPKDRTVLLEEISNSFAFKTEYDRLQGELMELECEFQIIYQKKKNLLTLKKSFEMFAKEATTYKELNDKYIEYHRNWYLFKLYHIAKDGKKLFESKKDKKIKLCQLKNEKIQKLSLLEEKKKEKNKLNCNLITMEEEVAQIEEKEREEESKCLAIEEEKKHMTKKLDLAQINLAKAITAEKMHKKVVNELTEELDKVRNMKTDFQKNLADRLNSQGSNIELNNLQVATYYKLKKQAQQQTGHQVSVYNSLKSKQIDEQQEIDMKKNRKIDLENKLNHKKTLKFDMGKRLKRLEESLVSVGNAITQNTEIKNSLETEIEKSNEMIDSLQSELNEINDKLSDAKLDKHMISDMHKKACTVQNLKEVFPEVHGRLRDLCQPINERYRIAITKILGKHINAIIVNNEKTARECINYLKLREVSIETFLPLDFLIVKRVKETLRDIREPKFVKLAYDLLNFPNEISRAVMFATNNALVCETPEDARKLAYDNLSSTRYNCVSLDGTYFQKSGLISGGSADLSRKARMWSETQVFELESRKEELKEKLKTLRNINLKKSELNTHNVHLNSLNLKLRYIQDDITEVTKQIDNLNQEIVTIETSIEEKSEEIKTMQCSVDDRAKEIEHLEKNINEVEDTVFKSFCAELNISNIREYEQQHLRFHQEQKEKQSALEEHYSRIQNQLEYEQERESNYNVSLWNEAVEKAKEQLRDICANEKHVKNHFDELKIEFNNLKFVYNNLKENIVLMDKEIDKARKEVKIVSRKVSICETDLNIILLNIDKKISQKNDILQNCKTMGIKISNAHLSDSTPNSGGTSTDATSTDESTLSDLEEVDFSFLPNEYLSTNKEDIDANEQKFIKNISEIKQKLDAIREPNMKAEKSLKDLAVNLNEVSKEISRISNLIKMKKKEFELVKYQRQGKFMDCLDFLANEVDSVYKKLLNDPSAQASLIPQNVEEPYLGGIEYSCIVPGKRFLPLSCMSGGEKTLAALALIFAMHNYRPSPFFLLDEVDAALDNNNIRKFLQYIYSKKNVMQFIIISLKLNFYSYADVLIGVSSNAQNDKRLESNIFTLDQKLYPRKLRSL